MKLRHRKLLLGIFEVASIFLVYAATRLPSDHGPAVWGSTGIFILGLPWSILTFFLGAGAIYGLILALIANGYLIWYFTAPISNSGSQGEK